MARRAGSLSAERQGRVDGKRLAQPPWSLFRNPLPPLAPLDDDGLERIEATAFRILEELGLEFQNDRALDILGKGGAVVDRTTQMVRFGRETIRKWVGKAPAEFRLHARNPERSLHLGSNSIVFAPVAGPPNVSDLDMGRRPGTSGDLATLIKLHQCLPMIHVSGGTVEPLDLSVETRHLDFANYHCSFSDRV